MNNRQVNLKSNEGAPASWCILPWSHISVNMTGNYQICCHAGPSPSRGIIKDNDDNLFHVSNAKLDDVINSNMMKRVRKDMLEGKWAEVCTRCEREYNSGMKSRNIYERTTMANLLDTESYSGYQKSAVLTKPDGSINNTDFPVSFLDIRFGNLCNLKCVMCGPNSSDQWYDDYVALWGKDEFDLDNSQKIKLIKNSKDKFKPVYDVFEWSDDENLWKQINQHIKQFRKLYIVGGEPLLIEAHYDFLKKCVEEGYSKNIMIEYNSNITNIPPRAWNLWKQFKEVIIGASIDGIEEVNDLIRYPSKWWKIEENLVKFLNVGDNFTLHITYTLQILNVWQFPKFLKYLIERNWNRKNNWGSSPLMLSSHPVHRPAYLNINILPDEFKKDIITHFKQSIIDFENTDFQKLYGDSNIASWNDKVSHAKTILETYISFMYQIEYTPEELNQRRAECIHYLDTLDIQRGTNWAKTCPELYTATLPWRSIVK